MSNASDPIIAWFMRRRELILSEWCELLRFPSVSSDPAHKTDCCACADWLREHLETLGCESECVETSGLPVVFGKLRAERQSTPSAPRVLFYGHYDVQPADPIEAWTTPPFEPTLRDGRLYARGAQDNKGQLFAFLQAVAYLRSQRSPLPDMRILIEGQEESGSSGLNAGIEDWRRRLGADVLMVSDTNRGAAGRLALTAGLRGVIHLTLRLQGAAHDLHSGVHGGLAPNPALGMSRLLASLHDANGAIAVDGFTDRVRPPSSEERSRAEAQAEAFDPEAYASATGVAPLGGEHGIPPWERTGFRPTIEINGIHGGYGGAGMKTIIPSQTTAKISCRLCPDQEPRAALNAIVLHLRQHVPPGLRVAILDSEIGGPGFRLPLRSPIFLLADEVLREIDARGPEFQWEGASIPIVSLLRDVSGAAPLLVGFGDEADRIHAPDESFSIEQFILALRYNAKMLALLGHADGSRQVVE